MATFLSAFWMVRTVHACTEQIHGMITDRNKQLNSQTAWSLIEKYCCYSSWNDWVEVTTKITSLLSNCLIKYEGMHVMWYHTIIIVSSTCLSLLKPRHAQSMLPHPFPWILPQFPNSLRPKMHLTSCWLSLTAPILLVHPLFKSTSLLLFIINQLQS